ncbi:MAG TPA: C45 family autoproteolytic acyltransferase/hydrolase [Desulfobacterales bacterium]
MPALRCGGSPHDIGAAVGGHFADRIRRCLEAHPKLYTEFVPSAQTPSGNARYHRLLDLHRSRYPDYMAELEGIAAGADIALSALFLINLRGEYAGLSGTAPTGGCSTGALHDTTASVIGHNEDGLAIYRGETYFLAVSPQKGPSFGAFCYPGFLPGNAFGFNSAGICFCVNNVQPVFLREGIGRHFIARSIFEATSLDEAVEKVTPEIRASGFHYTIASIRERRMVGVEVAPNDSRVIPIKGPYFHTNHYLSLENIAQKVSASSRFRLACGQRWIAAGRLRDRDCLLGLLRSREEALPVLRDGTHPDNLVTLATAIFDLQNKTLAIYAGEAGSNETGPGILARMPLPH